MAKRKPRNILLTCVGRRSYIVEYFRESIRPYGKIVGANSIPDTPGMDACDTSYVVPESDNKEYIPTLLKICKKEKIDTIVPLFDFDLGPLSRNRNAFTQHGVRVWVSPSEALRVAEDKAYTSAFCGSLGMKSPPHATCPKTLRIMAKKGEISFPVVVKPRFGTGSILTLTAKNQSEATFLFNYTKERLQSTYIPQESESEPVIIQQFIPGTEYGIDIFNSYEGNPEAVCVKKKIEMRSGETDAAVTVTNKTLEKIGHTIGAALKHVGCLDIDVISDGTNHYVIDINARFGGGYPFTHLAGMNFIEMLISENERNTSPKRITTCPKGIFARKFITPKIVSHRPTRKPDRDEH